MSIARNIVAIVASKAGDRQVLRVTLEIGEMSAVMPEALHFCFPRCCRNTVLEGAALDIVTIPLQLQCENCGQIFEKLGSRCDCGGPPLRCIAGEELKIKEMELN